MFSMGIIENINDLYFLVDLKHGTIDVSTPSGGISKSYKLCRNIQEANLYSLNVLRQNVNEERFKTGEEPKTINRWICGDNQVISVESIVPTMKWLQETFPEKFI